MGTVSPTIWRTMSAAPSATFEECDTITIPTLDMGSGSEFADNGGNHGVRRTERRDPYARPIDHQGTRHGRVQLSGVLSPRPQMRQSRRSLAEDRRRRASSACTGASTSSMVLQPTSDLPRAFTASIAFAKLAPRQPNLVKPAVPCRASEEGAVQRARRATDFHNELRADGLESIGKRLTRSLARSASTASKPRFMLMP